MADDQRPKKPGILARMARLERRIRALGRRVNTLVTSCHDSINELVKKVERVEGDVSQLKTKVTAIDLWRHKLRTPPPAPKTDD